MTMRNVLLILAALGWLTSVAGALLQHRGAVTMREDDGIVHLNDEKRVAAAGLLLVVIGASVGAAGTILGVIATSSSSMPGCSS